MILNMPNYNKCFIYKICCKDPTITDCYIGSTTNIIRRRSQHKSSCTCIGNRLYNQFVYTFIREHDGWDNFDLIALEEFSCETKMQQTKKERDWIENLKPTLNKVVPANYQTGEVYDVKEYHKEYNEKNKEAIKEHQKKYQQKEIYCPCCDHMINLSNRTHHNKTKKHISNSSSQSDTPIISDSDSN